MEDTIAILRGLESRYEVFHGVKITDNAIIAAATLSNRYITDRFLPDKAIDLIDEACAMIRTEMDSMPTELDVINRKIIQMEIEEAALKNEDDELSKGRLSELQKELAEQRDKFNTMKAQWENEKNAIGRVQQLREKIEQINREIETAQQNYDLEKAAKLMYGDLPEAKKQLEHEEKLAQNSKESSLLRNKVTEEEIAKIIERWTGIPTSKLMEGEREKLLRLPEILHKRVIGQDEAVSCVSDAILRSRGNWKTDICSFRRAIHLSSACAAFPDRRPSGPCSRWQSCATIHRFGRSRRCCRTSTSIKTHIGSTGHSTRIRSTRTANRSICCARSSSPDGARICSRFIQTATTPFRLRRRTSAQIFCRWWAARSPATRFCRDYST